MRRAVAFAAVIVLGGCMLGPDYEPPEVPVPGDYVQTAPPGESIANLPWWELFEDEVLRSLINTAIEQNKDLQIALLRISEARAAVGIARADLIPNVNFATGATRTETSETTGASDLRFDNNFLAADVFYEADIFGKFRRSTEAARRELLATEYAYRTVLITLVSDVASFYLLLRDLDNRLDVAERTLEGRLEQLRIIRARFDRGTVPELDVNQAEVQVAIAEAAIAQFQRQIIQAENAISVLLGRNPSEIDRGLSLADQPFSPDVPAGLPSELIQRRPDILTTEQRLAAQTARIGVAMALRFPSLTLTGALGVESQEFASLDLGTSQFWSVGADFFGPIFDAGRNKRRVEIEKARTEQLLLDYEQTVLIAFAEVEDALVSVRTYRSEYESRVRQVNAAANATRLSRARYDGGVTSYLEVLDSERSLFDAQLAASQTLQRHLVSIVELYKALGGGWDIGSVPTMP